MSKVEKWWPNEKMGIIISTHYTASKVKSIPFPFMAGDLLTVLDSSIRLYNINNTSVRDKDYFSIMKIFLTVILTLSRFSDTSAFKIFLFPIVQHHYHGNGRELY